MTYNPAIPIETFDVVIVDECHRSIYGVWRQVIEYLPPREEQIRIAGELERQLSFIEACERAVDIGLQRAAALRRSVLKAAFEGRLVPQDPTDEPAAVLLERIRAERSAAPKGRSRRARSTS